MDSTFRDLVPELRGLRCAIAWRLEHWWHNVMLSELNLTLPTLTADEVDRELAACA